MEWIIPVVAILLTIPGMQITNIEDFSRFSKHVGQQISLVDSKGVVREGLLAEATADAVKMQFSGGEKAFSKADVTSAERLHDGSVDGAIKGAIFGAVVGLLIAADAEPGEGFKYGIQSVALYGSIGFLLDVTQVHRQPIYGVARRTATTPKPALKLSLRF